MSYVTLRDIAKKAGVSTTTVSRALNNKDDIDPSTKERIIRLAEQMGYAPNAIARGLRVKKTKTIGTIIADISDPFFAPIVKGIESVARQEGYNIILSDTDENYEIEKEIIKTLIAKRVDGILITPVQSKFEDIIELKKKKIPFVLVGRHFNYDLLETDYVATNDIEGAFSAVDYLIKKGHRRILFINGPAHVSSAKERLAGYKRALFEAGIRIDESLIEEGGIKMEDGYRIAKQKLSSSVKFTAVFAYSDFVAIGVMKALKEAQIKVPRDVAVVGYDDIEFSPFLEVPLTTVKIPRYELGIEGFKLLKRRMEDKKGSPRRLILPTRLVIRKSA